MRAIVIGSFLALVFCAGAWVSAYAADPPATVGPFIAFCRADFAGCKDKISEIQLVELTGDLQNSTHNACTTPRGVTPNQGVADIVNWMIKHPEMKDMSVADGAHAAAKDLWNCAAKVKTGITSEGVPDTTGRYVAFCEDKKNFAKCANEAIGVDLDAYTEKLMNGTSAHCSAPEKTTTETVYAKSIAWLKAHPEENDNDVEESLARAIDATWPCK